MILYNSNDSKSILYNAAYKKAHKRISKIVEDLDPPLRFIDYGTDGFSYCPTVDDAVMGIFNAISMEEPSGMYNSFINEVDDHVAESWYTHIYTIFYFGLLYEYRHLFTSEELVRWRSRMMDLFRHFDDSVIHGYDDYMNMYLSDCETSTYDRQLKHKGKYFSEQMEYTFVFRDDMEYHTLDMYNVAFYSRLVDFAADYYAFYEDLTKEITKRKKGENDTVFNRAHKKEIAI